MFILYVFHHKLLIILCKKFSVSIWMYTLVFPDT